MKEAATHTRHDQDQGGHARHKGTIHEQYPSRIHLSPVIVAKASCKLLRMLLIALGLQVGPLLTPVVPKPVVPVEMQKATGNFPLGFGMGGQVYASILDQS